MAYLTFDNSELKCNHPKVKSIKDFGTLSSQKDSLMQYNIEFETTEGKQYRETSDNPELVKGKVEQILSTL